MKPSALIIGAQLPDTHPQTLNDHLSELARLLDTLGYEVTDSAVQRLNRIQAPCFVGKGFIRAVAVQYEPDLIAFEGQLTPSQRRNIKEETGIDVADRTSIILEIFRRHARSKEARIQVELAALRLQRAGLRESGLALAQQVGAIGVMGGKGEKQIELDRRTLDRRIVQLTRELSHIERRRDLTQKRRSSVFNVSLVGYTNAGKSTLLNHLTGESIKTGDKLFVTLDTTSRRWFLGSGEWAVLSDTVGFIRNLPHQLVASFRSTFRVAETSSLLVHVVDASADDFDEQIEVVKETLSDMGMKDHPRLLVFSKCDLVSEGKLNRYLNLFPDSLAISAFDKKGLKDMTGRVLTAKQEMDRRRET